MQTALIRQDTTSVRYGQFRPHQRAVQTSEARFFSLFEQSPSPMGFCSAEDGFATSFWNQAWFELMGFDPQDAQGKTGSELGFWACPGDREYVVQCLRAGQDLKDIEFRMRRLDGKCLWIAVSARKILEPEALVLVSFFDITERRHAQHEVALLNAKLESRVKERTHDLQHANQELSKTLQVLQLAQSRLVQAEKLSALGALVAGVAHELNTPIGNSLTVASALEHKVEVFERARHVGLRRSDVQRLVDDVKAAAELLVRNLARAGSVVDTFKQVAVMHSLTEKRDFSLADLVRRVITTRIAFLNAGQLRVTADMPDDLVMHGHSESVAQVFGQLIDNAIVHGFEQGQIGHVTVKIRRIGSDRLIAVVGDDGCGVDPDKINHVFEPFFTTRFGQGGSGLGLYIVHNIVTGVLDGEIQINSQAGQGTQVTLTLPLVAALTLGTAEE